MLSYCFWCFRQQIVKDAVPLATVQCTLHASEPTQALLPPPYPSNCWGVRLWHAKPTECQPLATDLAFQSMRRGRLLHECSRPKDCGAGTTLSGAHGRMRARHL